MFQAKNSVKKYKCSPYRCYTEAMVYILLNVTSIEEEKGMGTKVINKSKFSRTIMYRHWSYCSWQKGMSQDKVTLCTEEIKFVALSIVELRPCEGISLLLEKPVKQELLKFHSSLLYWFIVDLKTFLGFAIPNQYY